MASVIAGIVLGLFADFGATAVFILGLLFFPLYIWAIVQAFLSKRDWLAFGMIVAILLAWPAFTIACFSSASSAYGS